MAKRSPIDSRAIRVWLRTLRKLDHLCGLDHRRMHTEEIDWLVDAELVRRGIVPGTIEGAVADEPATVPARA